MFVGSWTLTVACVVLATAHFIEAAPCVTCVVAYNAQLKSCKEEVAATDADVELLKDFKNIPTTVTGKKLLLCAYKRDKWIVDGKLSLDNVNARAKTLLAGKPDEALKLEMAQYVAEKCAAEINAKVAASEEDLAVDIRTCLTSKSKMLTHDMQYGPTLAEVLSGNNPWLYGQPPQLPQLPLSYWPTLPSLSTLPSLNTFPSYSPYFPYGF